MKRTDQLTRHWYKLIDGVVKPKDLTSKKWYGLVHAAHSEEHRHYHTLMHLRELLTHFEVYEAQFQNPKRVLAAIFFHDIVYKTRRGLRPGYNEKKSAQIAEQALVEIGFDESFAKDVAMLIRHTADHKIDAANDPDGALFIDMDMAILGAERARYLEYSEQVQREYEGGYSAAEFCAGRLSRFVEPTLKAERIFHTATFQDAYEARARDNLRAEQKVLTDKLAQLTQAASFSLAKRPKP